MTGDPPFIDAPDAEIDHRATDRMIYSLWAVFWLLMVIVAVQDVMHSPYIKLWEPLVWEGSSALVGTVIISLQRRADRKYVQYLDQPWRWFAHHLKWFPLIAVGFIGSAFAIRHAIYAAVGMTYRHESWTFVAGYESVRLLLYISLWLGVIFGLHSFSRWRSQRQRLLTLQKTLAETQLAQLRAQLHPHFLFNALNTVSSLMQADVDRADRLLSRLGELLRITLQSSNEEMTSLRSELKQLALYADVMQERFPDRVTIRWQVPAELNAAIVPSLLLQPLLENAFKHGVEKCSVPVNVSIVAERIGDSLRVAIRNSGSTLPSDPRQGVGLRNSRERLRVIYGSAAKLELSQRDADIEAAVTLPYREHAA